MRIFTVLYLQWAGIKYRKNACELKTTKSRENTQCIQESAKVWMMMNLKAI